MSTDTPKPVGSTDKPGQIRGILVGLGLAGVVWFGVIFLMLRNLYDESLGNLFFALIYAAPLAAPGMVGFFAYQRGKRRFAVGLFIATGVVALVESACAINMLSNRFR